MTGILNILAGALGAVKDTYFNLVSLLLPGNGTNGAQNNTFLDSSTNNFTITRNGDTTQGTFSPFSQTGWGSTFSGSNQLTLPSALALAPEAGQFCIEFWIYPTASWGSTDKPIFVTAGSGGLWVGWTTMVFVLRAYGVTNHLTYATAPSLNTWTHVAICRNSGNTTSMYFNGNRVATGTVTQNFAQATTYIAADSPYGGSGAVLLMASSLSNLRLVKGSSVYDPTQSTITVPTSPLTAITNTTLLTCQSNRFIDNSTANSGSGWTVTPNGSPSIQAFSPFAPTSSYSAAAVGGSGYFDGSGDFLTTPNVTALNLYNTTNTVECWIYPLSFATNLQIYGTEFDGTYYTLWFINPTTGYPAYQSRNGTTITASSGITLNQWNHVVWGRSGTTMSIWINGTRFANGTISVEDQWGTGLITIGRFNGADRMNGYLSGLRVVKGTDVYGVSNTSITVPTSPSTAITNTSLLLNFTNAGVVDATAKNVLETEGSAQISTSVSKWPGGSISLPQVSTTDYLRDPSTFIFSGDFVIEGWIYFSSSSTGFPSLFSSTTASQLQLQFNSTGATYYFSFAGSAIINAQASGLSADTWTHFAIVRSGTAANNISVYFGGTRKNQATSTATVTQALVIGVDHAFVNPFKGYIDDFRITVGTTRGYSGASITVPTAPFPLQ